MRDLVFVETFEATDPTEPYELALEQAVKSKSANWLHSGLGIRPPVSTFKLARIVEDGDHIRYQSLLNEEPIYGERATAVCLVNPEHKTPDASCRCGFRGDIAFDRYLLEWDPTWDPSDPVVLLNVILSGRIVVFGGRLGYEYRAEHQTVVRSRFMSIDESAGVRPPYVGGALAYARSPPPNSPMPGAMELALPESPTREGIAPAARYGTTPVPIPDEVPGTDVRE